MICLCCQENVSNPVQEKSLNKKSLAHLSVANSKYFQMHQDQNGTTSEKKGDNLSEIIHIDCD